MIRITDGRVSINGTPIFFGRARVTPDGLLEVVVALPYTSQATLHFHRCVTAPIAKDDVAMIDKQRKQRMCVVVPADSYVDGHGFRVSLVKEGDAGHFPTGTWPYSGAVGENMPWFWGPTYEDAKNAARAQNEAWGLTEEDVFDIVSSSMRQGREDS